MNVMDKESTKIIKAVAIVLMLLHHFWAFGDSWIVSACVDGTIPILWIFYLNCNTLYVL